MTRTTDKAPELSPEEIAQRNVMGFIHLFCAQGLVLFDGDQQLELIFRRIATRMRYLLIVGEDPKLAEIRDQVVAALEARRARIAALLAP